MTKRAVVYRGVVGWVTNRAVVYRGVVGDGPHGSIPGVVGWATDRTVVYRGDVGWVTDRTVVYRGSWGGWFARGSLPEVVRWVVCAR